MATTRQAPRRAAPDGRTLALRRVLLGPAGRTVAALLLPTFLFLLAGPDNPIGVAAGLLMALALVALLLVGVHEAGRAVAGHLMGFAFRYLLIGPVRIEATERGTTVDVNDDPDRYATVVGVPTRLDRLATRTAVMLAGGPLANLLLALLLVAELRLFRPGFPTSFWLASVALLSFAIALGDAYPLARRGRTSAGALIHRFLAGGWVGELACINWLLLEQARLGARPRDWDSGLIERAISIADDSADGALATYLTYLWAVDRGDMEWAGQLLQRSISGSGAAPAELQTAIFAEAAFFSAHYYKDADNARGFLDDMAAIAPAGGAVEPGEAGEAGKAAKSARPPDSAIRLARLRAEAALLVLEGDDREARARCEEWQDLRALEPPTLPGLARPGESWVRKTLAEGAPAGTERRLAVA